MFSSTLRITSQFSNRTKNGGEDRLWKCLIFRLPRIGDLGSGQTSHRYSLLIDLYLYTKCFQNRTTKIFCTISVMFQSYMTQKLGQISKVRLDQIQIFSSSFRITSQFRDRAKNGGGDRLWKWQIFRIPRARDLDPDLGSGQESYRCASLIDLYLHNKFH